ncbi:unnamed protein product [Symbiodinium pilosum]|uniref:Uncharacterized protein n=1 Tax=Symbiodinium pilosum TaxID=2952 RepID=A0A812W3A0_SYMPI|nr:unnamed protein product [Symbiodinium pilosum]
MSSPFLGHKTTRCTLPGRRPWLTRGRPKPKHRLSSKKSSLHTTRWERCG